MKLLEGQVAIVSGSTSGIGRSIAQRFAAEGAGVVVNSVRSIEAGQALAATLPDAVYVPADISDEAQARSLVDAAMARWGRLDVVVNNAGAAAMLDHRDLDGLSDEIWRRMLDVNLMGTWYLSRAAVGPLSVSGGSIVNITSLAGVHPTGSGSSIAYGVAKAAVNHLTVLLANALGAEGIRVNAIAVGPIETPMWNRDLTEIREKMKTSTVLGRAGLPDEIAQTCLMLAAPGFTTAQVLVVDGGMQFRVPR
jgi:ketoreductase RED2